MHLTITWPVEWLKVTRVQYGQTTALLGCEPGWIGVKGNRLPDAGPGYCYCDMGLQAGKKRNRVPRGVGEASRTKDSLRSTLHSFLCPSPWGVFVLHSLQERAVYPPCLYL